MDGPVRVTLNVFLSKRRLFFISPAAPAIFPSPSPGAQDNFPLHAAKPLE